MLLHRISFCTSRSIVKHHNSHKNHDKLFCKLDTSVRLNILSAICQNTLLNSCVPTPHINNYRNCDIVPGTFITELIAIRLKHYMAGKVPKSKDFYEFTRCSNATVSTCAVCGNISTGCAYTKRNPPSTRTRTSRARVDGLQETYTNRFAPHASSASNTGRSQPLRGGSIRTASGWYPSRTSCGRTSSAFPQ